MLTKDEKELVANSAENYPADIPAMAWGRSNDFLPMCSDYDFPQPIEVNLETCVEYG